MICINGNRECNACGGCMEQEPIMYDLNGISIYEGDAYWEIDGIIYSEETLEEYKHLA